MRPFIENFAQRRREIRRYLAVLIKAEDKILQAGARKHDRELNIMRAAAMLVVYNAIEASAREGIQAIYDEIDVVGVSVDDLCEPLRRRVLLDFRRLDVDRKVMPMRNVALEMVTATFDPLRLFSGNVDARALREKSEEYGFVINADKRRTRAGADLLTVKDKRNDLAHGHLTFSEVGREYTSSQIKAIAARSLAYVEAVLIAIDDYLSQRTFLSSTDAPPATSSEPA